MDLPENGQVLSISSVASNNMKYIGNVRVTGRLIHHNCETGQATLCDPQTNSTVSIDTTLTEPLESVVGSLFQVIGEVEQSRKGGPIIKARIMRCVDGLDLLLYSRALEIQQQYMQSRLSETCHS